MVKTKKKSNIKSKTATKSKKSLRSSKDKESQNHSTNSLTTQRATHDSKTIPIDKNKILMKNKSFLARSYWEEKKKAKRHNKNLLINMQLRNGNHRTFHVEIENNGFTWEGGQYINDNQRHYYNLDYREYMADYHQDFALPLKRDFPIVQLNESIELNDDEIELSTNPSLLKRFLLSGIAEQIMKGADLDEIFRKLYLFAVITLVVVVGTLLLLLKTTGMLDNLKLPF